MFSKTRGLYILNDKDEIILLNPASFKKDLSDILGSYSTNLASTIIMDTLKTSEYIKFPLGNNKYKVISKDTDLISLCMDLRKNSDSNNYNENYNDNVRVTLINTIMKVIEKNSDRYLFVLERIIETVNAETGNKRFNTITIFRKLIKDILTYVNNSLETFNRIEEFNILEKSIKIKNECIYREYNFENILDFVLNPENYNILKDGYYYDIKIQHILDKQVFENYSKNKKWLQRALALDNTSSYSLNSIKYANLLKIKSPLDFRDFMQLRHSKNYGTSIMGVLHGLKLGIDIEYLITSTPNVDMNRIKDFFSFLSAWPKDYENEILELISKIAVKNNYFFDEILVSIPRIKSMFFSVSENLEFMNKFFELVKDNFKNFLDEKKYSFDYIKAYFNMTKERNLKFAYDHVLFSNDNDMLLYSKIGERESDFAMMCHVLFRMDPERRKIISDETVEEIIRIGVNSFIGPTETYSLRNRMARTMASLIHEKDTEDDTSLKSFEKPRDKDIRYLIEQFSNSKLRSSFFVKIFNMPQELDSNYYMVKRRMGKDQFFRRAYSEFTNLIDDIDYSEDLDSVILLLALS